MDEECEKRLFQELNSYNQAWCESSNEIVAYLEKLNKEGGELDIAYVIGLDAKTGKKMMNEYSGLLTKLMQLIRDDKIRNATRKKGIFG